MTSGDGFQAGDGGPQTAVGPRLVRNNHGLVASNLGKRYKKRPVLRGVSVRVRRGSVAAPERGTTHRSLHT